MGAADFYVDKMLTLMRIKARATEAAVAANAAERAAVEAAARAAVDVRAAAGGGAPRARADVLARRFLEWLCEVGCPRLRELWWTSLCVVSRAGEFDLMSYCFWFVRARSPCAS